MKIILGLFLASLFIIISCTNKLPDGKTTNQSPANEFGKVLFLKYGESLLVGKENIKISFLDIKESRCPKGVNCITEGKAKVQLQIQGKDLNETIQLVAKGLCYKIDGSCGNEVMANEYKFQMINVDPYPVQKPVTKEENVVKFVVSK